MPVTLTSRPKVHTIFERPDTRRFDYHSGLDTCPIFSFVLSCVAVGLAMSRSPVQGAVANV